MQPHPEIAHRRLALLIATSEYHDPALRRLRAPGHDARDLAKVLANPQIGGFAVQTLINTHHGELLQRIEGFCADRRIDDQLLIYLSCHGVLDERGRLYYAATDTQRHRAAATAISAAWLNERLDDCRARSQVVILDCCHSGAFAGGSKGNLDLALEHRFQPQGRGRVVLTASRGTEYSFESDQPSGVGVNSVFTKAIIDGLSTGDADGDKDGVITVTNLYRFAYDKVRAIEPRQTPELWTYGAEGDVVIAYSIRGPIIEPAVLPEDLRLTIESPRPRVRETAVAELAELLDTARPALVLSARQALQKISSEDVPRVARLASIAIAARQRMAAREVSRELTERGQRERGPHVALPEPAEQGREGEITAAANAAAYQSRASTPYASFTSDARPRVWSSAPKISHGKEDWHSIDRLGRASGIQCALAATCYVIPVFALILAFNRNSFLRLNAIQALMLGIIGFVLPLVTIGPDYQNSPANNLVPSVPQPWFGLLLTLGISGLCGSVGLTLFCLVQVIRRKLPKVILLTRVAAAIAGKNAQKLVSIQETMRSEHHRR